MRVILALALVGSSMAAGGCASAPKTMTMPDGRVATMAYCDGAQDSMATCYNAAAAKCGGPYEVVNRSESMAVNGYDKSVSSRPMREIAFICKAA